VRAWLDAWLATTPAEFESPRIRDAFIAAVLRDAGGLPAAVEQMLAGALAEREVSRRTVRDLSSDAATTYLE
jgi:hypothetical protein